MCAAIHPAPTDDLYSGFDEVHPALDIKHLQQDPNFQEAVRSSYGRRPPTQSRAPTGLGRLSTAQPLATGMKTGIGLGTAGGSAGDGLRRPMTSVMGTGYSSQQTVFDPMNQTSKGPAPPLLSKADERTLHFHLPSACGNGTYKDTCALNAIPLPAPKEIVL
ncbi:hypothetical protein FHG87_011690 [Trinorchestia longiramus]|nr:hypothetical protein FHG87_011690 [Trinorchestia longiramus]